MISKKERLTREQFTALLATRGLRSKTDQLGTLKYILGIRKFSVVTSSKHEKSAVARNRIRRKIYTLFSKEKGNIQGILYISKKAYGFKKEELESFFYEIFKKIDNSTK